MSRKYKIREQEKLYFITLTVVNWVDIFIRGEFRQLFLESVRYCQKNKGLEVYAWCVMSSHIHLILRSGGAEKLENIIRDLKSFTSRSIRKELENTELVYESRKDWMMWMFKRAGLKNSNNKDFQFWVQHNHPIELNSNRMMEEKLEYIHQNPVAAGFVEEPEAWLYSSARDYAGYKGLLDIILIE